MRKLFGTRRLLAVGLTGALILALALVAGLLAQSQIASAQPVGPWPDVILIHVNPDGSDYLGNPYCPDGGQPEILEPDGVDDDVNKLVDFDADTLPDEGEQDIVDRAVDDCNNVMGSEHVIRTRGFDGDTMLGLGFILQNGPAGSPANAEIIAQGRCGNLAEVINRPEWDAVVDDLLPGQQPPPLGLKDDEACVVIKSTLPGETVVHFTYVWDEDGTGPIEAVELTTDPIVKEWDSIIDTVILKAEPADEDGDTDIDATDHHLADQQGTTEDDAVVFDEAQKRIRAPIPVQIVEIVHGVHVGQADGEQGVELHHPTEGAIITATIDSPRGCTYFTNPLIEIDVDGDTTVDVRIPAGSINMGDEVDGVSDWEGRIVYGAIRDLWLDTICEEQATVIITVDYPEVVASAPDLPDPEEITINWVTVEAAKQPQIRWAGEEIVLAKRWALPDDWFPNLLPDDTFAPICPNAFKIARYNRLTTSTAGDLIAGIPEVFEPFNNVDQIWSVVDPWCVSRAIATSEDQGEGDFEATLHSWQVELGPLEGTTNVTAYIMAQNELNRLNVLLADGKISQEAALADMGLTFESLVSEAEFATDPDQYNLSELENKHAWLVWWLKIYQVKLDNILLDSDGNGREDHNAGIWKGEDAATSAGDVAETLNVSQDALLRVTVKGWFRGGDQSARGAVCIDMNGNGDGDDTTTTDTPGVPYPLTQYEAGCPDAGDEILDHGAWVLPDDLPALAGPQPDRIPTWDVMHDIDEEPSDIGLIGPKSSLDSHDPVGEPVARAWVPCLNSILDEQVFRGTHAAGVNICPRKTIDPDGEITVADALMPPLKIRATIPNDNDGEAEAGEAGFLKEAFKEADVGITSAYQSIMIPADPDIPPIVNNGGYDWDSWACRLPWYSSVFVEFPDDFFDPMNPDPDDLPEIAMVCNGGWGLAQGPYEFYQELTKTTIDGMPVDMQFYTDNRGQGFFFANGDYNLTFDDCPPDELTGTPVCSPGDLVGTTDISVIGDYPYFRKHSAVLSNPVVKTWLWGGFKDVTAQSIDINHTAIIAHLKDRDGFCKWDVDIDEDTLDIDVVFSPSMHPVEGEEIEFILNNKGVASIIGVSPNALFSAPQTPLGEALVTGSEDGVVINLDDAVALAEDARVLDGMVDNGMSAAGFGARAPIEEDECQAWIVVQHPADVVPDVSVIFNDPEGQVTRHYPPKSREVRLVQGWNDSCYTGRDVPIEEALADIIDNVLAVYLYDPTDTADPWKGFFPDRPDVSQIETLSPYDQLFILMDASADWPMEITNPPADAALLKDWNSVCYAGAAKSPADATASIAGDFQIIYTLASDQAWRRYVPGRDDLNTIGATLDQFTSVLILVTAEDGATWVFDP